MKILFLEPFYGGSHAAFANGWRENSQHEITIVGLPDRRWKWRMRHSGIALAHELLRAHQPRDFDLVVASSMLPLAEWQGLAGPAWAAKKSVVYFHENQLTYPLQDPDAKPDYQYGFSNIVSCLAAHEVWFNSSFHKNAFVEASVSFLKRMPDFQPTDFFQSASKSFQVLYPGIDSVEPREETTAQDAGPITILWPHRWEFDKKPEDFLKVLSILDRKIDFRLFLLGHDYTKVPNSISEIRNRYGDKILNSGFFESKKDYWNCLAKSDVAVSTAIHEFFGIAMVEAASQGVACLLPDRLAYPEVFNSEYSSDFIYGQRPEELAAKIVELDQDRNKLKLLKEASKSLGRQYHWQQAAKQLDAAAARVFGCSNNAGNNLL